MSNLRRFLSRHWLFGAAMVLVSLPMLHPFVRQAIFGPTIDGIPWCVWEDEARRQVDEDEPLPESWLTAALEKLGLLRRDGVGLDLESTAAMPLHLHLADNRDVKVRRFALERLQVRLATRLPKHQAEITATLRRHFDDDDLECRLTAAYGVWATAKETRIKQIMLAALDQDDPRIRVGAACMLADMASAAPDLFEPLAKLTEDADHRVKSHALYGMHHFGKRGVPILRKGLFDSDNRIRNSAIYITSTLGKHGMELTPILQTFEEDPDPEIRNNAACALYRMDPMRFAKPAGVD